MCPPTPILYMLIEINKKKHMSVPPPLHRDLRDRQTDRRTLWIFIVDESSILFQFDCELLS